MALTSTDSVRDIFTGQDQPVLRCAVYTRQSVATAEQDLTSCDVQRERCENYVRAMQCEGWQLLDEHFDDVGVSGAELSRPGLDKLKSWCVQAGIELVFVDGGTNARGPLADLVNNIVASFAEFEQELIREQLLDAHVDAHARMRERGLRCAARESAASIARWANDAGHRTKVHGRQGGNRWSGRTVLQILRNPIYVGERMHAGGTVEGVHDGIIDADEAQRAWCAIDERRTRQPEPRGPALDWDRDPYMLRGLLRCAGCGRVMTTSASAKVTIDNADEVSRYYRCRGDAERPACTPSVQVSAQKVEAIVLAVLKKADPRTIPDRRSRALLEHLRPSWDTWFHAERNRMVRDQRAPVRVRRRREVLWRRPTREDPRRPTTALMPRPP